MRSTYFDTDHVKGCGRFNYNQTKAQDGSVTFDSRHKPVLCDAYTRTIPTCAADSLQRYAVWRIRSHLQSREGRGDFGLQCKRLLKQIKTTFMCRIMSLNSQLARFSNLNLVLYTLMLCITLSFLRSVLSCQLSKHGELVDCPGGPQGLRLASETGFFQELVTTGKNHACAIRHVTGRVVCWKTNTSSLVVEEVNVPQWVKKAKSISLGMHYSCAIWGAQNTLSCWGSDEKMFSDSPVNISKGVRILAVGHPKARHACFLRESENDVSCFGYNEQGQLGLGSHGQHILAVTAEKLRPD